MHHGVAFLKDLRRVVADEGFVVAIFAVVAAATVLAFGFGATSELVTSVLVIGVLTAVVESRPHTKS